MLTPLPSSLERKPWTARGGGEGALQVRASNFYSEVGDVKVSPGMVQTSPSEPVELFINIMPGSASFITMSLKIYFYFLFL